jgi:hypothetical protein
MFQVPGRFCPGELLVLHQVLERLVVQRIDDLHTKWLCAKITNSDAAAGEVREEVCGRWKKKSERPGATHIESLRDLLVDQPN